MKFTVVIKASKEGSIGSKYCERRVYVIDAPSQEEVSRLAIERVYQEGGLEHVLVTSITEV